MANNVLPQLNVEFFAPQIFWLLLVFFILYLIIKIKIVPYFEAETGGREKKIFNQLQEAEKLRLKANRLAHDYNEKIQAVHLRANDLIAEAKIKGNHRVEAEKKRLNLELTEDLSLEQKKINEHYVLLEKSLMDSRESFVPKVLSKVSHNDGIYKLENLRSN